MSLEINSFNDLGYSILISSDALKAAIDEIRNDVIDLAHSYGFEIAIGEEDEGSEVPLGADRSNFYRSLRYLPSLGRLAHSSILCDASVKLGLRRPIVMNASNIRMDKGGVNPNKFHWHQDYTYLLGSSNSVTYWIPLQNVSRELGGVELIPGSHASGISEFVEASETVKQKTSHISPSDIVLKTEPETAAEAVDLQYGDALVFSQFLLHRSVEHSGPHTRWTVQIRHSDALEPFYREHGGPMGDTTTILKQPELLQALRK